MLKFFRNIRQKLLTENSFKKYIIYAFGEIFLVVIGILIALQLNKWNDHQKNLSNATIYITELKKDLILDTLIFGMEIKKIDQQIEYKKWGLLNENFNVIPTSKIEDLFICQYHNIKMNDNSFERIKNSEVFSLEKHNKLFKNVTSYYSFHQKYLTNFNEWEVELFTKDFYFWFEQNDFEIELSLEQNDSINVRQNDKIRKAAILTKVNSIQGRNHLKMNLIREKTMRDVYQRIYNKAVEILIEIDKK